MFLLLGSLVAACATGDEQAAAEPAHDVRSLADVTELAVPGASATTAPPLALATTAPTLAVAEFEATVTSDGSFDVRLLDVSEWENAPADAELRRAEQALWCPVRVAAGEEGALTLTTDLDSIGLTPTACDLPDAFPYATLGVFCADVTVSSALGVRLESVQAEITSVAPSDGYNGYTFDATSGLIGTDPLSLAGDAGAPSGALGLFGHGG